MGVFSTIGQSFFPHTAPLPLQGVSTGDFSPAALSKNSQTFLLQNQRKAWSPSFLSSLLWKKPATTVQNVMETSWAQKGWLVGMTFAMGCENSGITSGAAITAGSLVVGALGLVFGALSWIRPHARTHRSKEFLKHLREDMLAQPVVPSIGRREDLEKAKEIFTSGKKTIHTYTGPAETGKSTFVTLVMQYAMRDQNGRLYKSRDYEGRFFSNINPKKIHPIKVTFPSIRSSYQLGLLKKEVRDLLKGGKQVIVDFSEIKFDVTNTNDPSNADTRQVMTELKDWVENINKAIEQSEAHGMVSMYENLFLVGSTTDEAYKNIKSKNGSSSLKSCMTQRPLAPLTSAAFIQENLAREKKRYKSAVELTSYAAQLAEMAKENKLVTGQITDLIHRIYTKLAINSQAPVEGIFQTSLEEILNDRALPEKKKKKSETQVLN